MGSLGRRRSDPARSGCTSGHRISTRATLTGAAKIRIDTLEPIESTLGRWQLRCVLAWAELHQEELLTNWRLARAGETLNEIDLLR